MASNIEQRALEKAEKFRADAESALKGGFLSNMFKGKQKFEDASENYKLAAAQFKLGKAMLEAGKCYELAAENAEKAGNDLEANQYYTEAAKAYRGVDVKRAQEFYEIALERLTDADKMTSAAKMCKDVASMFESELQHSEARKYYQRAAEYYGFGAQTTSANNCLIKVAEYAAMEQDFKSGAEIFERVSRESVDNNLTKWSVTQWLFKAGLCHLAICSESNNMKNMERILSQYKDMHAQFEASRESKLLDDITATWDEKNLEAFTTAVAEYDSISKLDSWKSSILLHIKKQMKAASEVLVEDADVDDEDFT